MTMETFKYGDKATHPRYGTVKVHNVYPDANLVQIIHSNGVDQAMVHPVSLTKVVDPWRAVDITWVSGETTRTRVRSSELIQYLGTLPMDKVATLEVAATE